MGTFPTVYAEMLFSAAGVAVWAEANPRTAAAIGIDRLLELLRRCAKPCTWTSDEDGTYHTSCDEAYQFIDGGPVENKQRFCGYCGRSLQVGMNTERSGDGDAN